MFNLEPSLIYQIAMFLLFTLWNVLLFALRKTPKLAYGIAYCIAIFLLIQKIIEYSYGQIMGDRMKFPVEFSALSYFFFGIAIIFKMTKVEFVTTFMASLAGLMFLVTSIAVPSSYIPYETSLTEFIFTIINHNLLYFGGMLMVCDVRRYNVRKCYWIPIVTGVMVAYSWIICLFTDYTKSYPNPIIIRISSGKIIHELFDEASITPLHYIVYYIIACSLLVLLMVGFYAINNWCANRRFKYHLKDSYYTHVVI